MVFSKDELHCDIFAPVLFIQWIFVEPYELTKISHVLFLSSIVGIVLGPFVFGVSRFQIQIPYMFLAWTFESMRGVFHYER